MAELFLAPLFTWRSAIASEQGPGPTTRHVLLTLSLHMSERGDSCWPSQETLAMETGLSLRAVKEHLKLAHQQGWISSRERQTNGKAWRHKEYFSLIPESFHVKHGRAPDAPKKQEDLPKNDAGAPNAPAKGGAASALGGAPDSNMVVHQVHTSTSVNSTKNSKSIGGSAAPPPDADPFEVAWKTLPARAGNNPKRDALKAWNGRLAEGVAADAMIAGAQRYCRFCDLHKKTGSEFVMRGSTFFGPSRPFEQAFAVPDEDIKPRVEQQCIHMDANGVRCEEDGKVTIGEVELGGIVVKVSACERHYKPAIFDEGAKRLVPDPEMSALCHRFKDSEAVLA